MRSEPDWPPVELLIELNAELTTDTGEPHNLLSRSLLESAWARPISLWSYGEEDDLVLLAVALMAGIGQNHPFQQGNKRTAFLGGVTFLEMNGAVLSGVLDSADLADAFVALLEHRLDEAAFAAMLRPHVFDD